MEFVAPATSQFLLVQGDPAGGRFVEHLHFKGLAFKHGQWLTPAGGYGPAQAAQNIEAAVMLDGAALGAVIVGLVRSAAVHVHMVTTSQSSR